MEEIYGWNGPQLEPTQAITTGISTILDTTKRVLVVRKGLENAESVYNMLFGELGSHNPAGWIRTHPNVTVLLDKGSAKFVMERLKVSQVN